ncbi:uncharacterized protein LOC108631631 [Ceratina calcarata]|uniref:Uncharacterized protein LOC108631631 n=1 Tax=Ceratina calcarata TaxID=156304 RepID=A0AAJ7JF05_9HYME|nr:uncharacterized protein LOC108631631 [Ceratina calcarata]
MKWIVIVLLCAVAYAQELSDADQSSDWYRFRREADPQGSITLDAQKPLSGPDRRPSLDLNYNQRVYDRNGANANAYGGVNVRPGQAASPHLGVNFGKDYRNGQLGGFVQGQRGPGGRISPSAGLQGSWRFRRDVDESMYLGEEEKPRFRREDSTGLIAKDLAGSKDNPSASIGWNQRVIERDGLTGDVFGGARVTSGKTPSPEFGATLRKDFDSGHVGGFARYDKNPLGSFSPSYGVDGSYKTENGWRTDLSASERRDPWGKSQSVGAGFGREFNNGNGYAGVITGAQKSPFGDWQPSIGANVGMKW